MIVIVGIEFINIIGHGQCGKGRHHGWNRNKNGGETIFRLSERNAISLTGKKIGIEQSDGKTEIDNYR